MKDKIPSIRKQNPAIPQSVENILLKATAKNPRNRYDTTFIFKEFVKIEINDTIHTKNSTIQNSKTEVEQTNMIA